MINKRGTPGNPKHKESPNEDRCTKRYTQALIRDNFQLIVALHVHGLPGTLLPLIHCMFIQQTGVFMGKIAVI